MGFEDTLAEYGLNTMQASFSVCIIILLTLFFLSSGSSGTDNGIGDEIELHPEHVKYMKKKEEEHCSSNFGKGLRCIIDYLREEDDKAVKKIFAEKPKYTEGFEKHEISLHPPQFEWLEEKGIKVGTEKGEEYKEISRVARACFDWAMRQEAEGNSQDYTLFEYVRCLNC